MVDYSREEGEHAREGRGYRADQEEEESMSEEGDDVLDSSYSVYHDHLYRNASSGMYQWSPYVH